MLSHSEEEPVLIVERTGFCILLHYEHNMTVFPRLHKTISFGIKHNGGSLYYFFNHSSFFMAHVRGSRQPMRRSTYQTGTAGCVSRLRAAMGLPGAVQAVNQEYSLFCPPTAKAPKQIHIAESMLAPTEVTGHHYSSKQWF